MMLNFNLRFASSFGQSLYILGSSEELGAWDFSRAVAMHYINEQSWGLSIEIKTAGHLSYKYILKIEGDGEHIQPSVNVISLSSRKVNAITVLDEWNSPSDFNNVFLTQPFKKVFKKDAKERKTVLPKSFTHSFSVLSPVLGDDEVVCLLGSGITLKNWSPLKPILLEKKEHYWETRLIVKEEPLPIAYKYGIYSKKKKAFISFEGGDNRIISSKISTPVFIHDGFARFSVKPWKCAGVAIPVFSLRTKNSFGTGEFSDIKLLADWAGKAGIKLIQLLPVNDTTASHSNKDSYPYAAISAFALHPLYINLDKVAGKQHAALLKAWNRKKLQLNSRDFVDYENVMKFKRSALKEIFSLEKEIFLQDEGFKNFFSVNKHWLQPYAAFCYLRDKYGSADTAQWKSNSVFNDTFIKQLCAPSQKHHLEIVFNYFTQYHLHLQLQEAADYAHKKGIAIKGDLPIGVYRYGADVWQEPDEFIMEQQAGAPPDDFAVKGQNWGFPTYNWKKMQEEGFAWWQRRFEQMGHYFDAFRIDHILGFFRIWSIPLHAVEGILGRFVPAIPVHLDELNRLNISFSVNRYCQPFISEAYLNELFGADATYVKETFLEYDRLKEEFNTQRKVEAYFTANTEKNFLQAGLFDLISNVILFDEGDGKRFHFRYGALQTHSYNNLDIHARQQLNDLYINYFYRRQDEFWKNEAMKKLPGLKAATDMLVCGEDLGMVPHCVPGVMADLGILSLEIQRMPKQSGVEFLHPQQAPYTSVITPSTHDMSTIRGWWEEDYTTTQHFYNNILSFEGKAPVFCEPYINEAIVEQHLQSPAMLCVFQMQDYLGSSEKLRRKNPQEERINVPADPNHFWKYRMHITLETLIKEKEFNEKLKEAIAKAGR